MMKKRSVLTATLYLDLRGVSLGRFVSWHLFFLFHLTLVSLLSCSALHRETGIHNFPNTFSVTTPSFWTESWTIGEHSCNKHHNKFKTLAHCNIFASWCLFSLAIWITRCHRVRPCKGGDGGGVCCQDQEAPAERRLMLGVFLCFLIIRLVTWRNLCITVGFIHIHPSLTQLQWPYF